MAAEALIRAARPSDAEHLAPLMRMWDAVEVDACGLSPIAALNQSLAVSQEAYALELGGEVAALFGVERGPARTLLGAPTFNVVWALTGRAVDKHPLAFARASRRVLCSLLERYQVLVNLIDARYSRALGWARWLGAELLAPVPFGHDGELFHPVVFRRQSWAQPA